MSETTIVIAPRERFSSIISSLKSLFKTIDETVPVIVVEGASPFWVRSSLRKLQKKRDFKLISLDYLITPNEARNIGANEAKTEFIAFCDNDLEYEPGWLSALEKNAQENDSALVAPLIFIGPFEQPTIHHAGGYLYWTEEEGGRVLRERHRLMNAIYPKIENTIDEHAPIENEVCEFHGLLIRRSFLKQIGGLDDRLITREQMDLALRAKAYDAKVTFAKDSHVSYLAKTSFRITDLIYHMYRWSDELAIQSIDAFQDSWGIRLDEERIRKKWIAKHRQRACYALENKMLLKVIGDRRVKKYLAPLFEKIAKSMAKKRDLKSLSQNIPFTPNVEKALGNIIVEDRKKVGL